MVETSSVFNHTDSPTKQKLQKDQERTNTKKEN